MASRSSTARLDNSAIRDGVCSEPKTVFPASFYRCPEKSDRVASVAEPRSGNSVLARMSVGDSVCGNMAVDWNRDLRGAILHL